MMTKKSHLTLCVGFCEVSEVFQMFSAVSFASTIQDRRAIACNQKHITDERKRQINRAGVMLLSFFKIKQFIFFFILFK